MIFGDTGAVQRVYVHPDALFGCGWCPTQKNVIATGCKVSRSGQIHSSANDELNRELPPLAPAKSS